MNQANQEGEGRATGPAAAPADRWRILATLMIGMFMAVLDVNIVNIALPHMISALRTDLDRIRWVVTAYGIVFAIFTMLSDWLRRRLGPQRLYLASLALFTIASALCGLGWNLESMVGFRILQAAASGVMMPLGFALISMAFPPQERGKAFGAFGIVIVLAPSIGPTLGGYLVDEMSWRDIFYVNVPVGMLGFGIATLTLRHLPRERPAGRFDVAGFLALSVFLVALLLALSDGQREGWTSNYILGCFALAAIGLILFVVVDLTVSNPLVDLSLFGNGPFSLISLLSLVRAAGLFGRVFLLPIFLQRIVGYTAIRTGLLMAPGALLAGLLMPIVGRFSDRHGARPFILSGFILLTLSQWMYRDLTGADSFGQIFGPHLVWGLSMAALQAPLTSSAMNVVKPFQIGMASGLQSVIFQIGGSFGVATLGTVLQRQQAVQYVRFSEAARADLLPEGDLGPLGQDLLILAATRQSLINAFDVAYLTLALICLVGILIVPFLPRLRPTPSQPH